MKRLYILRHSKAGQTNKHLPEDHNRTLTEKGEELCPLVAEEIEKHGKPELAVSSDAARARSTAELTLDALSSDDIPLELEHRLYLADTDEILSVIQEVDDNVQSLLVVGHNPGLHHFCLMLPSEGDKTLYREMKRHFPTASLVVFDLPIESWDELRFQKNAELVDFIPVKKKQS